MTRLSGAVTKWKDDVVAEICSRYCGSRAHELGDPAAVRLVLDQWAPLTVDEAEKEMDELTQNTAAPPS